MLTNFIDIKQSITKCEKHSRKTLEHSQNRSNIIERIFFFTHHCIPQKHKP